MRDFVYEVMRGPKRWRMYLLPRAERKRRERAALEVVAAAATKLVDTPLGAGLSLRQAAKLPPDLRPDVYIALLSGSVHLRPDELDRVLNDAESVRAEFPEMFVAKS